jgi:hypothetical protein
MRGGLAVLADLHSAGLDLFIACGTMEYKNPCIVVISKFRQHEVRDYNAATDLVGMHVSLTMSLVVVAGSRNPVSQLEEKFEVLVSCFS